ncbi:hypothetical protein GYMLUDRAFT_60245 [Collybiopsis luxurians FD-317 M1]|uniref:Uncharacterized protein n=1 Tax=Collybiopsis luxurians FD-317 M1 TaxID=944289 RepID=A0A0D0CLC5_9AGAR|nr:hypothetical protein GYMLUDRAFT_60245 [Collybiopsis luxurians FD-317 M1]
MHLNFKLPHLFALLYFWAAILSVSASPLPNGNDTVLHFTARKNAGEPSSKALKLPVQLRRIKEGTDGEHWFLVLDSTYAFHAQMVDEDGPLKSTETPYQADQKDKLIDLDCTAMVKNQQTLERLRRELVKNVQLQKSPKEKGSNCMDYVQLALEYMKKEKFIPAVPRKFTEIYKESYEKVSQKVWGDSDSEKRRRRLRAIYDSLNI